MRVRQLFVCVSASVFFCVSFSCFLCFLLLAICLRVCVRELQMFLLTVVVSWVCVCMCFGQMSPFIVHVFNNYYHIFVHKNFSFISNVVPNCCKINARSSLNTTFCVCFSLIRYAIDNFVSVRFILLSSVCGILL